MKIDSLSVDGNDKMIVVVKGEFGWRKRFGTSLIQENAALHSTWRSMKHCLEWHSKGEIGPVLRFYEWEPATLSIGYFQSVEKEIDMDEVKKHGLGFVRRPTGGRGVLHEHELTYSVIVSESYPEYA